MNFSSNNNNRKHKHTDASKHVWNVGDESVYQSLLITIFSSIMHTIIENSTETYESVIEYM